MTQTELIDAVAEKAELSKVEAARVVKAVFTGIENALKAGEDVRIPGFGGFEVTEHAAREGRNPKTGETIAIAESKAVKFKAGKDLRDAVNGQS